jgi:Family of unknown function (DUF5681)
MTTSQKRTGREQRGQRQPFRPGISGNPRGRPKGVPNKAAVEINEFALRRAEDLPSDVAAAIEAEAGAC